MFDEPRFAAATVAELIDARPSEIRDWRDRGLSRYCGTKLDHAVVYSIRDAAFLAVCRDLIKLGFHVEAAANISAALLEKVPSSTAAFRGTTADLAALVPIAAPGNMFTRQTFTVPGALDTRIEIPIGAIWSRVVGRAMEMAA